MRVLADRRSDLLCNDMFVTSSHKPLESSDWRIADEKKMAVPVSFLLNEMEILHVFLRVCVRMDIGTA